jgi:hypothetical protein
MMLDAQSYLESRLKTCSVVAKGGTFHAPSDSLEDAILSHLLSKRFRKWAVSPEYLQEIRAQVRYAISQRRPIEPTWFFGGYKLWSLPSAPEVDWAEFFFIAYVLSYIAPIAAIYEPGVHFIFWTAHPSIMQRQSNIPEADCLRYRQTFSKLLEHFQPGLPKNAHFSLRCFDELYPNEKDYSSELELHITEVERAFREDWSAEQKEKKKASSTLNIQWVGAEDWTTLSPDEKLEKIRLGPIVHDGYCSLSSVNKALRGPGRLDLSTVPLPSGSIPIGTTASSVTKFWTGFGVLEHRGDRFVDRILSPQQLEEVKSLPSEEIPIDLIPLKNFQTVRVYPELRFSNRV